MVNIPQLVGISIGKYPYMEIAKLSGLSMLLSGMILQVPFGSKNGCKLRSNFPLLWGCQVILPPKFLQGPEPITIHGVKWSPLKYYGLINW